MYLSLVEMFIHLFTCLFISVFAFLFGHFLSKKRRRWSLAWLHDFFFTANLILVITSIRQGEKNFVFPRFQVQVTSLTLLTPCFNLNRVSAHILDGLVTKPLFKGDKNSIFACII